MKTSQVTDYQVDDKVKKLAKERGVSFSEVCRKIGMTDTGLSGSLKKGSLKLQTLIDLSNYFGVPLNYFVTNTNDFSNDQNSDGGTYKVELINQLQARLEDALKDKEFYRELLSKSYLGKPEESDYAISDNIIKVEFWKQYKNPALINF
ncbi:hypothetical protein SAMN04515674_101436 [Pseudarcicella hirudinis]|uniref:HTH cro/C1-type domain-containing protein n=1 Tax=Pseudarcicella hirudinis TaxID=1079859 RepID=A0A1I5MT83_9BACT|nr:helix-turn-helix transcriptional regulator [Pseudarcicella hirudinis]SFP12700.1 hypothetical protein SAMN04515674_101436 [Pseudarcicella hirudinis]